MYNLVSCYDTLELKSRGDVLSDKVYMSDPGEGDGEMLRISQSESILTDMTHVISPMSAKSPLSSRSRGEWCWWYLDLTIRHFFLPGSPLQPHPSNGGGPNCITNNGLSKPVSVIELALVISYKATTVFSCNDLNKTWL